MVNRAYFIPPGLPPCPTCGSVLGVPESIRNKAMGVYVCVSCRRDVVLETHAIGCDMDEDCSCKVVQPKKQHARPAAEQLKLFPSR